MDSCQHPVLAASTLASRITPPTSARDLRPPPWARIPGWGGDESAEDRRGRGGLQAPLSLSPSAGLTITDIRLVSVLQGSGVLAFPEAPDAICLGEGSGVRHQEGKEMELSLFGQESQIAQNNIWLYGSGEWIGGRARTWVPSLAPQKTNNNCKTR